MRSLENLYKIPFELRHLYYFLGVAEELNFSRAATRLGIEQPPLSQQIGELEKRLNVKLFDRSKRPIILTEAGQTFLEEVRLIMNQLERAIQTTQKVAKGEIGKLRLGFNSSAANSVLPNILKSFQTCFPEVELDLQEGTADSLIAGLEKQQIDVGLMHWSALYNKDDKLFYQTIREEPLILVLAENHPLAFEKEISIQSLADETFILPPPNLSYGLYKPINDFFTKIQFTPKKIDKATVMLTILSLVAGETGVSILPANVQNIQRQGVVYKPLKQTTPIVQIVAMWHSENSSPVWKNFLDLLPNEA